MFLRRLALWSLLAGSPLVSFAQSNATPFPRYYVGLALYSSGYQPLGSNFYQGVTVPVQLTVGYQLRPRLAVQASVAYSSSQASYLSLGSYYSSGAATSPYAYSTYDGANTLRTTSTTLLARYTLTRPAVHRFQVDLLGGITMVKQRYTDAGVRTDIDSTSTATSSYTYEYTYGQLLLTIGAGARYRFSRHLEALLDVTFSLNFLLADNPSATTLGLRYRFGGLH